MKICREIPGIEEIEELGSNLLLLKNYDYDYVRDGITVLGLNRYRHYVYEFVPKDLIENVRFARTYKPKIMDMMYEYEGHDGWWGDSDEDGLDAKQFAINWPEFQKMKRHGYFKLILYGELNKE